MKDFIFDNGLKFIYKKSNSELSSICISLDAGAARDGEVLGVAHVTEHMVYKGTETRSEKEINTELSSIFGFQNAMTNYPYVVFYGTLLSEDLNNLFNKYYKGLYRGIYKKEGPGVDGIYNQDISPNSILIEVGGVDNNIDEVLNTTEAISNILYYYIKGDNNG